MQSQPDTYHRTMERSTFQLEWMSVSLDRRMCNKSYSHLSPTHALYAPTTTREKDVEQHIPELGSCTDVTTPWGLLHCKDQQQKLSRTHMGKQARYQDQVVISLSLSRQDTFLNGRIHLSITKKFRKPTLRICHERPINSPWSEIRQVV